MRKKKNNIKRVLLFFLILFIVSLIYVTYWGNTNFNSSNYESQSISSTNDMQTVENAILNSSSITDMIEHVSKSVVGISKFKKIIILYFL